MNKLYLVRHAETEWSNAKKHTSFTDLPLTEEGKKQAYTIGEKLHKIPFKHIYTSPLLRALQTCEIAGYQYEAEQLSELVEWNYGVYEGLTTDEIHKDCPEWNIFLHGAPHGESVEQVEKRAHRIKAKMLQEISQGDILIFSSAHFLRALAAAWIGMPVTVGSKLQLSTSSLSILGWEHRELAIESWNVSF